MWSLDKRKVVQEEAQEAIKKNNYTGICDISPRVGKSKILIDSIRDKSDWNVVITAPYNSILNSWEEEFEKWGLETRPKVLNQRSLKKIEENIDLLVLDEVQTLSANQKAIIAEKKPKRILGLSGTVSLDTSYSLMYELGLKNIYTYSIDQAIQDDIISNFNVHVIKCTLDNNEKYIKSGTKKNPFMTTEKGHYDYTTKLFEQYKIRGMQEPFYRPFKTIYARKRQQLIYTAKSKFEVAKGLVDKLGRSLSFAGTTDNADMLAEASYHTKNKKEGNLQKFIDGEVNKLAVVEMVNMGITIPNLKTAVIHQMKSNSEMSLQKILRTCNLEDDKVANIYITTYADTVDYDWTMASLTDVKSERIHIVDDLTQIL